MDAVESSRLRLVAETNAMTRQIRFDYPTWYPAAFGLSNLTLMLTVSSRMSWRNRRAGTAMATALTVPVPIAVIYTLARNPERFSMLALLCGVLFVGGAVGLLIDLVHRFDRIDIAGDFQS